MKTTGDLRIRVSTFDKNILKYNAKLQGLTLSGYCKKKIFSDDLKKSLDSLHFKVDKILIDFFIDS